MHPGQGAEMGNEAAFILTIIDDLMEDFLLLFLIQI
jgi:hypothetical protein